MKTEPTINLSRLDLARRRRGMTKRVLAELTGVSTRSLVAYTSERREPSRSVIARFSEVLRFPPEFFYGPTLEEPPLEGASFRAFSRVPRRIRDQAIAAGTLGLSLSDWIEERFSLPETHIPRYESADPEVAAMELRSQWRLGEHPIKNIIHLLELHGARIFSLAEDAASIDAYSFWRDDIPYIFLNTIKSAERSRMDAAHELGHLVLHSKSGSQRNRLAEEEAQQFGSAFLMPRDSVLAHAPRRGTLRQLIEAKQYWIVSLVNLTYRMHKLELLSDHQYRMMFIEIGRNNYRTEEPEGAERETSQVLEKVLQTLREEGITIVQLARTLSIHPGELSKLLFGLVQTPLVVDTRTHR